MAAATVHVTLQSMLNASFDHTIDTEIPLDEWNGMSPAEQSREVEATMWEYVDAFASDEDGEPI